MDFPPLDDAFFDEVVPILFAILFTIVAVFRAVRGVRRIPQQMRRYTSQVPKEVECINCHEMTLRSEPRCLHCYAPLAPSLERSPTPPAPSITGFPPVNPALPHDDREVPPLVKKI